MAGIEGRWVAEARQATFGETPIRRVNPGDIADLVFEPNGRGHSYKKGFFGQKELSFTWTKMTNEYFHVDFGGGFWLLCNYIAEHDLLSTAWTSPIKSVDGMGVVYRRG